MTTITFDVTLFRQLFPAFADPILFPDATLQQFWNSATCYISDQDYGFLNGDCRLQALNLMTAHLTALSVIIAKGQVPYIVQGATIDKVTLSLVPPPVKNEWRWWLFTTPYGQQLYSLLFVTGVGGFYIGGLPERSAFRCVGGIFPPPQIF